MLEISEADIGGARVVRTFNTNGRYLKRGDILSADDVLSIRLPNRRALVDSNFIEIYPKAPMVGGDRFLVGVGNNEYNVIEGKIINDKPLTRKEADKLLRS